jgi:hypothetical protein
MHPAVGATGRLPRARNTHDSSDSAGECLHLPDTRNAAKGCREVRRMLIAQVLQGVVRDLTSGTEKIGDRYFYEEFR